MFTCSTLLQFPFPVPADIHGSVQHVTLSRVPVDVLSRLFLLFSQAKHFECNVIHPPQEVQCVHMYSVAWDALVCNHYLAETVEGWGRGCVWGTMWESCVGELCLRSCVGEEEPRMRMQVYSDMCTCTVWLGRIVFCTNHYI